MRNEASVEIERPIDEVFRLTNDHVAEWSTIVVEDRIIHQTPEGVGTTFVTVTEDRGQRMEFQGVVTRYDPPHVSGIRLTGAMFDIETEFAFEDLLGRIRVTQRTHVVGKGFFKMCLAVFGWLMRRSQCRASHNELESLKRYCERQADRWHN